MPPKKIVQEARFRNMYMKCLPQVVGTKVRVLREFAILPKMHQTLRAIYKLITKKGYWEGKFKKND
jgi:hypothetical protein